MASGLVEVAEGVICDARLVTPERVLDPGWIRIENSKVAEIGTGSAPTLKATSATTANGAWLFPAFVDLHCHGGGGGSFTEPDPTSIATAISFHRTHGTATMLGSTVSASHEHLRETCSALAPFVERHELGGIHLEGPYLSVARCGAQNPAHLRHPSLAELDELWIASKRTIRQITIAPELPRAFEAIAWMIERNIIPAIGHTGADAPTVQRAIDAGARIATHICNAMPQLHHRDATATSALLDDERVTVELIADGIHLSPATVRLLAARTTPRQRLSLITDAIAVTGHGDVVFELGDLRGHVLGGVARITGTAHHETTHHEGTHHEGTHHEGTHAEGPLAGSTLTMIQAVRNALAFGLDPVDIAHAAATTPGRLLQLNNHQIALGAPAEFVLIEESD